MTISEGQIITRNNFTEVGPGSVLVYEGEHYQVLENGHAIRSAFRDIYPLFTLGHWSSVRVQTLADQPVRAMTPEQFKQKVRTFTFGESERNGITLAPVADALRNLGCTEVPPLGVGMWINESDGPLWDRLCAKTGLSFVSGNPNWWDSFGVWDAARRPIDGGQRHWPRMARVLTMDDPETDAYLATPTAEDADEVARLRGLVWTIGIRAKSDNSWCAAFEATIGALGITGDNVQITAGETPASQVGQVISGEEVAALPVGAILQYPSDTQAPNSYWNFTQRVAPSVGYGPEVTHFLLGENSGHHGGRVRVLWDGTGEMRIPVISEQVMDLAPTGTQVACLLDSTDPDGDVSQTSRYTKQADGSWCGPNNYSHAPAAFYPGQTPHVWRFVHFPQIVRQGNGDQRFTAND